MQDLRVFALRIVATAIMLFTVVLPAAAQMPAADASKIFAYDATEPLNLRIGKSETPEDGVTVSEISYDSPKAGRVPGYLAVPSATCIGDKETRASFCLKQSRCRTVV